MRTKIFYTSVLAGLLSLSFIGCNDNIDPIITELNVKRVFSPIELTARIRTLTTIELDWKIRDDANHYVVEFSEDSLEFNSIIRTVTVLPDELPLQEVFFGDILYSARVKGVSADGIEDSKWTAIAIRTDPENIFLPISNGDIAAVEATLKWTAGSEVTHFLINPGNIERPITDEEKADGEATITGLSGRTEYDVALKLGNGQRGVAEFKTLVDADAVNATKVEPTDDLAAVITGAPDGQILVLNAGDYASTGLITINKSVTIIGQYPYNKPKLHVQFNLEGGAQAVELTDLDLSGDALLSDLVRYNTAATDFGSLLISGCSIHDFTRTLVGGNVASKVASVTIDNCVVTDIISTGGDFIDFRNTYLADLNITNSTFDNCAPGRDFVRMDAAAGYSGTGLTSDVLIDHCTLYGVSNTQDRILYVRFVDNILNVTNTIIAATDGYYSNQPATTQPVCSKNNYFNAAGFITPAYVTNAKTDISGSHTTFDPGFTDALNGNFKVSNQTLKDDTIGDPRWLQ